MAKKRDRFDRMFFGFRDQLTPRYGYEAAKRLAYQFIKRLRKTKECVHVGNLRCCDMANMFDRIKYDKLRLKDTHYNGMYQVDDYVEVLGWKYRVGFDVISDWD